MSGQGFTSLVGRNLRRRPGRGVLLALSVAGAVGMLAAAGWMEVSGRRGIERTQARLGPDLVAVPDESPELPAGSLPGALGRSYMGREVEHRIASFEFVEQTSALACLGSMPGDAWGRDLPVSLVGFEPESDFCLGPRLEEPLAAPLAPDQVVLGFELKAYKPGDTIEIFDQRFRVAGIMVPSGEDIDAAVFIPMEAAYALASDPRASRDWGLSLPPDRISAVTIKLKPLPQGGLEPAAAGHELNKGIYEIRVIEPGRFLKGAHAGLAGSLAGLRAAGSALWPVTALFVGLCFAMAASERRQEIGLLRAMGATRGFILGLMVLEALVLAGAGAMGGLTMAAVLVRALTPATELSSVWPPAMEAVRLLAGLVVLALLTGAVAALGPAVAASRLEPDRAIRGQ